MCRTIATQFYSECRCTIRIDTGKPAPVCLLGAQCKEVGYTHKVFMRMGDRSCPDCAPATTTIKKGKNATPQGQQRLHQPLPEPKVPHYRHDKEACIAVARKKLHQVLQDDTLTDRQCKDIFFYILGLPSWMKKGALVMAFGTGVHGYYGEKWEQETLRIAKARHFDKALLAGFQTKRE